LITISSSHPAAGLGWGFVQSWLLHQFKKNAIPAPEEKQFLLFYNKKTPRPAFQQQRDVTSIKH
jgi:hypothetical protein